MREEQELIEEARRSREETEQLREELERDRDTEPSPGEPRETTSSGDADSITDNED